MLLSMDYSDFKLPEADAFELDHPASLITVFIYIMNSCHFNKA